jgi:hypothetical protein
LASLIVAFASLARADHPEPAKAKAITFPLVNDIG